MAELIAIGYGDELTAAQAAEDLRARSQQAGIIEPDATAAVTRDGDGTFSVRTNHHLVGSEATWGMFWAPLFGYLFFTPVFGMGVGAGLGVLTGKVETMGIDPAFAEQVRDLVQPGTSALFLIVERGASREPIDELSRFGGRVVVSSLSPAAVADIQELLHGDSAVR